MSFRKRALTRPNLGAQRKKPEPVADKPTLVEEKKTQEILPEERG